MNEKSIHILNEMSHLYINIFFTLLIPVKAFHKDILVFELSKAFLYAL